ncbi:hypothetical protein QOT17_018881 [Balamuthia mandrillaris]
MGLLINAIDAGDPDEALRCIALGTDIDAKDTKQTGEESYVQRAPLHAAVQQLQDESDPEKRELWVKLILLLIEYGADLSAEYEKYEERRWGQTTLQAITAYDMIAQRADHDEDFAVLLKKIEQQREEGDE